MTVEIEFKRVDSRKARLSELQMARQIEENERFPIQDISRRIKGQNMIVEVETTLPSEAVDNMLSDIEDHLNDDAEHVETREV